MNFWKEYVRTLLATLQYAAGELVITNLLWAASVLLIVTIPPATAGLFYATNQMAHQKTVTWRTFFTGFRSYVWASWRWFLVHAILVGALLFNILYGSDLFPGWTESLRALYWALLIAWSLLQLYSFPLLIEQEEPSVRLAFRNSALLCIAHLPFNLFLAAIVGLVIVASNILRVPWLIISIAFIAYLANLGLLFITSSERRGER